MLVDLLLNTNPEQIRHILVTTSSQPEIVDMVRQARVTHYQPKGQFRFDPNKFREMARWMRAQDVQVVHSYNAFANAWASITTELANIPTLLAGEHGTVWNVRPPMSWLDAWAHRRARLVIANSQASAKLVGLKYHTPEEKIRVVHNAVADIPLIDIQQARKFLDIDQDLLVVGSVGRLDTPKNYETFIEAASIVLRSRTDVIFVLVGGGPLESKLRAYVSALGIEDRFLMTGNRADARILMQGFDIFVSTSIYESFGNTLIEAALCKKPVIAPNVDGIPEIVQDGITGILLPPVKPVVTKRLPGASPLARKVVINGQVTSPKSVSSQELFQSVNEMLDNPKLRWAYGDAAYTRAIELFALNRYKNDLEKIYLSLV